MELQYLVGLKKELKIFDGSPQNPFEGAYTHTRVLLVRDTL